MKKNMLFTGVFLIAALLFVGCGDSGSSGNTDPKTITITDITGFTGTVTVYVSSTTDQSGIVAAGTGSVTNGSVTVDLKEVSDDGTPTATDWTDNGSYYIAIVQGDTFKVAGKVSINSATVSVPFLSFVDDPSELGGDGIDAKWQGRYEGGTYYVIVNSTTATHNIGSDPGTVNITTETGGNVMYSGSVIGSWVYVLSEGATIGFVMDITEVQIGTSIALGVEGVTRLIASVTTNGGSFSPSPPSTNGLPNDFWFVGEK
jgi:hypothetical protein